MKSLRFLRVALFAFLFCGALIFSACGGKSSASGLSANKSKVHKNPHATFLIPDDVTKATLIIGEGNGPVYFELTFEVIDEGDETNWEAAFSGTVAIKDKWLTEPVRIQIPHGTITELAGGSGGTIVLDIMSTGSDSLQIHSLEIYINSSGSQMRRGYVVSAASVTATKDGFTQPISGDLEGLKVEVSWAAPSAE